ncbi:MAG: potassium channel protein [Bacteroidetes bacterium]|nr:potassium channel protein [Bacteroidota bacterium]
MPIKTTRNYLLSVIARLYTFRGSSLSLRVALIVFIIDIGIGVIGFMVLEGYKVVEAFYMTVITVSTVGFSVVRPLSPEGQVFTSILIIINIGIIAYAASAFTYFVIQGDFFKNLHYRLMESKFEELRDHVILCGYGKYGKEIVGHLKKHNLQFVVIERNQKRINQIRSDKDKILFIEDDATHDEVLIKAGVERAEAIISALAEDSDNVFIVLTARQLNPTIHIISRAVSPKTQSKLMRAGADHVIMPEQIGGFYIATLVTKPGAVEFFSFISDEYHSDVGFEELKYKDMPPSCQGKSIRKLHIRKHTGANIIGFKKPDSGYIVNPSPGTKLIKNSSFILLGSKEQLIKLKEYIQELKGVQ